MAGKKPEINPRYACFKLCVAGSSIHRWGVYAGEPIPANKKVMEYTGERISRKETKRRAELSDLIYLFTVNSYWCLDGSVGGSGAEYVNHSCAPNIRAWVCKGHILYMSLREIRKGEELTLDYNFGKDADKVLCRCGTASCRGTINVKH